MNYELKYVVQLVSPRQLVIVRTNYREQSKKVYTQAESEFILCSTLYLIFAQEHIGNSILDNVDMATAATSHFSILYAMLLG